MHDRDVRRDLAVAISANWSSEALPAIHSGASPAISQSRQSVEWAVSGLSPRHVRTAGSKGAPASGATAKRRNLRSSTGKPRPASSRMQRADQNLLNSQKCLRCDDSRFSEWKRPWLSATSTEARHKGQCRLSHQKRREAAGQNQSPARTVQRYYFKHRAQAGQPRGGCGQGEADPIAYQTQGCA
jgi:hypothetical protein